MDWSYPEDAMDASDPGGILVLTRRFAGELDGGWPTGTTLLFDAREMLVSTREIERAAAPGDRLLVGFQREEKLKRELARYRRLVDAGVDILAMGVGDELSAGERPVRWITLPEDHLALENQWYIVALGRESLAFVGYELSVPERWGFGGISDPRRRFSGFVTGDERVVASLVARLDAVADADDGGLR